MNQSSFSFFFAAALMIGCGGASTQPEGPAKAPVPDVRGEEVRYSSGETTLVGYLAYDHAQKGERPGVLVVHEWWGHNEYARTRARQLAGMGYTALAVDMYGEGKNTVHPADAKTFMMAVMGNMPEARLRFEAAHTLLREHTSTEPSKIAAIGYCFGGAVALHMARAGLDLDLVASFHGNLATENPAAPGAIKGKVLAFHGDADPFVPAEQVDAFKKEMAAASVDYQFVGYPDVVHSFTNPGATAVGKQHKMPLAYNEAADKDSWGILSAELTRAFSDE